MARWSDLSPTEIKLYGFHFTKPMSVPTLNTVSKPGILGLIKNKKILEKVQKRAITMTSGLTGSTYDREAERWWFDLPGEQMKARKYDPSLETTTWT